MCFPQREKAETALRPGMPRCSKVDFSSLQMEHRRITTSPACTSSMATSRATRGGAAGAKHRRATWRKVAKWLWQAAAAAWRGWSTACCPLPPPRPGFVGKHGLSNEERHTAIKLPFKIYLLFLPRLSFSRRRSNTGPSPRACFRQARLHEVRAIKSESAAVWNVICKNACAHTPCRRGGRGGES